MNYSFPRVEKLSETRQKHRKLEYDLIPNRLIELAKMGVYYESRVLSPSPNCVPSSVLYTVESN